MEFDHVAVELDDLFSVKQSVKTKSDRMCFKLKLKYEKSLHPLGALPASPTHPALDSEGEEKDESSADQPKGYKALKKAMGCVMKNPGTCPRVLHLLFLGEI